MAYTISLFRDLIASTGNSWAALKAYLTSEAGGRLVVTESACGRYAIIHYDKTLTCMDFAHVRWFRSVVWDTVANMPLSVAPPKSSVPAVHPPSGPAALEASAAQAPAPIQQYQDYLDGVNINIFRTKEDTQLKIATRTSFGAQGNFYSKRSFADLFADSMAAVPYEPVKRALEFNDCCPDDHEQSRFISVLMQHPEHRVVEPVTEPRLWLLHLGIVHKSGIIVIDESVCTIPALPAPQPDETQVAWFERIAATKDWRWRGAVLKDGAGNRWRMKSMAYQMIRHLRGNTPRPAERFFGLRSQGLIPTYLAYYPEETDEFIKYEAKVRAMTAHLAEYYCQIYRLKTIELGQAVPSFWHTHLKALQRTYMSTLRARGEKVTKAVVAAYMNALPVPRLMFLLRVGADQVAEAWSTAAAVAEPDDL